MQRPEVPLNISWVERFARSRREKILASARYVHSRHAKVNSSGYFHDNAGVVTLEGTKSSASAEIVLTAQKSGAYAEIYVVDACEQLTLNDSNV